MIVSQVRSQFGTKRPTVQTAERFLKHHAEYVPKPRILQDRGPAQSRFARPFTRRLLCQLSYTGEGLTAW
jgi:hypothetical protein